MYPKNTWYVACTPDEFDSKPLGRTICGEPMVFYRGTDNRVVALEDFCPHRGAPLSLGFVENGLLVCGYHGLAMGCDGHTASMPNQRVQHFPCIKTYAVRERYGFVWVWPGDQALADDSLIPHLHWAESPDWAYGGGLYHIGCDYRLMVDNLMDLTHETYVHASSIGQKEIDEAPVNTRVEGSEVITSRFMENISAPPFWRAALRGNGLADDVPVDRWQICRFTPPSHVLIEVGVAHAGHGGYEAPAQYKAGSIVVDFITPENDTSIWYFWGMARNFKADDQALTDSIREGQGKIFSEDLEMLERQQRNLLRHPERALLKLNIDAGGVQARRIIERLIAAEQAPADANLLARSGA
ncbi:MAG: aromatic ring-hydroxylating dioxygenase subunit alpha [Gammaproteobacteria bacterium]|nr:aromatic ring-hydroxylating dioxygenase subunit alpha [Gammaproteobacteria bacterium]MBU2138540.1 aromatic ring-hydroxylating dioxygenase subunit alpha [Gammaproteobacteria bacterium]